MSEPNKDGTKIVRPKFSNINALTDLPNYRLPLAGIVSILHRISGFLLFLALPIILYLLDQSLISEDTFDYFSAIVSNFWIKLILLALIWGYLQHFCSGTRHLIMDNHIGLDKDSARQSAVSVLVVSSLLTLLVALKMFGFMGVAQ
jgi:succinate dehydrogenase / fumarate reductase, cytochrome b subunit